jgi:hypothetical protein
MGIVFVQNKATIEDVVKQLEDDQERMVEPVIFNDETDGITIKNWLTDEGISYRKTVLEHKSFNIDNI